MKTYAKSKLLAAVPMSNSKSITFDNNEEITVVDLIVESTAATSQEVNKDYLVIQRGNGATLKMQMGEYARLRLNDGTAISASEDEDVAIVERFKVTAKEDRKDAAGEVLYPSQSYINFDTLVKEAKENKSPDWTTLRANGVKKDNKFAPLQVYTIEVL